MLALLLLAVPTLAWADDDSGVVIDVKGAKRGAYPLAIQGATSDDTSKQVQDVASFDMKVAGWFKVLDPAGFLDNTSGLAIDPQKWKDVGAYGVIKYQVTSSGGNEKLEFSLYEVSKGSTAVLSKTYSGGADDVRGFVHSWCNAVVKYYTGEDGFFGSKIAFVVKAKKKAAIYAMDFDGNGVYALTRNKSINLFPAWSPSGGQVAFTSYMRNNPDLYVVGAGGGRPKKLSTQKGMNTGASWSPDGSKIAVTLSKDGQPDIYIISAKDGSVITRVTDDKAIDTSPAWSPDGSQLAFVSDREGGPQIFVVSTSGGKAKRVSKNGDYNTTPIWSPAKGAHVIAYTTRASGSYDIVTLDVDSGKMTRVTDDGSNTEPAFSPNGRVIAYAHSGKEPGVYLVNADGSGKAQKVYGGSATEVDWGPAPAP